MRLVRSRCRLALALVGAVFASSLMSLPAAAQTSEPTSTDGPVITRVSAYGDGSQVTGDSFAQDLSADGRHVLYTIHAQLWTLDRVTGARVQQDAGATSGSITWRGRMTPDARFLAFTTNRALVSTDTNGVVDVYVRDRDVDRDGVLDEPGAVSTDLVSVGPGGEPSTHDNWDAEISDDGNVVTWQARTTSAWGSPRGQIWLRDRTSGTSTSATGGSLSSRHGLSGDGRYLVWTSYAYNEGVEWGHGERELFLLDRQTGDKTALGRTPSGAYAHPMDPTISPDGRQVGFSSYEPDLVVPDSGFDEDVFVLDRTTGQWQAVNRRPDGSPGTAATRGVAFSTDSSYVMFTGGDGGLVAGDTNSHEDAFVRALDDSQPTMRVAVTADGQQPDGWVGMGAVGDGARAVLFGAGATNLVPGDSNSRPDAFLRTGGASPAPPVRHDLAVASAGTGTGTVTSSPAGISCPPTCTASFDEGTSVVLTAAPAAGSSFDGFSGDCSGADCTVSMTAARAVTATFSALPAPEPPVARDDLFDATGDAPLTVAAPGVLGNDEDPEGGALRAAVATPPVHGSLDLSADGGFTYLPQAGYVGTDSFTYTASDGQGLSDEAVVSIKVAPPLPDHAIVWSRLMGGLWAAAPGSTPTQVLSGEAWQPSWSPDRSQVVFAADRDPDRDQWDLWVVNADGSGLRRLTDDAAGDEQPAWSPDGSRIAFSSMVGTDPEIFTIAPDGSSRRRLTSSPDAFDYAPAWSPDGRRIAWEKAGDLWVMNADGSGATSLRATAAWEAGPSWSPDGTTVAYNSSVSPAIPQLRLVGADGAGDHEVATGIWSTGPSWSPDGRYLAFTGWVDRESDVYVVAPDGSGLRKVSTAAGHDIDPDWGTNPVAAPPAPALAVTATSATTDVVAGTSFTVAGTARSVSSAPVAGAVLELTVDGAGVVTASPSTCTTTATGVRCALGDLAGGQTVPYELQLTAGNPGTATVSARLTCSCDADPATASVSRTVVAAPPAEPTSLAVQVSGPTQVVQGDQHVYTFTVVNGASAAANKVVLYLGAYGSTGFTQPVSGTTSSQGSCSSANRCELGTVPAGGKVVVTATVHIKLGIDFNVSGYVTCSCQDADTSDNRMLLPVKVTAKADLTLTYKTGAPSGPGQPISWIASVEGLSGQSGSRVPTLVVEFTVPAGVTVRSVSTALPHSPPGSCVTTGNLVRCTWSPASGTPRVQITGIPAGGGSYVLVGRIVDCGGCLDPNPANDEVAAPPVVVPNSADLSISKTVDGSGPYMVGDVVSWRVRVHNAGPDAATDSRLLDRLPPGFTYAGVTTTQGSCGLRNGAITCQLGSIAVGTSVTVVVQLRPTMPQSAAVNTATTWCDCWQVAGTRYKTSSAAPIKIEMSVKPVVLTPCTKFTTMSTCRLGLFVPNGNRTQIRPGGTVTLGPIDPVNGPRLDPDATFPRGITCQDLGTSIRCTIAAVAAGGVRFTLPLVSTGPAGITGSVTWDCGCWSGGAVVTPLPPLRPTQACIGGQVLFHSNASSDDDIYAARLDGSGWTNLTDNVVTDEAGAVWSPDGRHFAFDRGDSVRQTRRLWIAALDGFGCIERQWRVPNQPAADNYQPDWSASGNRLAFVSKVNGNHDIYTIGVDGSGLRRITTHAADDRAPSFSDDGQRIAFVRNRGTVRQPNWDVMSIRADGTDARFLGQPGSGYASHGADYSPTYSRGLGSDKIIWHSNYGSRDWDLWSMNPDGSGKRKISGASADAEKNPEWSDDGTQVVYDGGTGTNGIWIMGADGSNRRKIADTGGIDQAPSIIKDVPFPYPCGMQSESGGFGVTSRVTEMGRTSGTFWLDYDTYSVPDSIEVLYQGRVIWSTGGPVSGPARASISFSGTSTKVTVRVTGETQGTAWRYTAGCPV